MADVLWKSACKQNYSQNYTRGRRLSQAFYSALLGAILMQVATWSMFPWILNVLLVIGAVGSGAAHHFWFRHADKAVYIYLWMEQQLKQGEFVLRTTNSAPPAGYRLPYLAIQMCDAPHVKSASRIFPVNDRWHTISREETNIRLHSLTTGMTMIGPPKGVLMTLISQSFIDDNEGTSPLVH